MFIIYESIILLVWNRWDLSLVKQQLFSIVFIIYYFIDLQWTLSLEKQYLLFIINLFLIWQFIVLLYCTCIWGNVCTLFQTCTQYNTQISCNIGTDGNCSWVGTSCILKQNCSSYLTSQNCLNGIDGTCAWITTNSTQTCLLTHCKDTNNPATCLCQDGYFNSCTQRCDKQCLTCNTTSDQCLTCNSGYSTPPTCAIECGKAQPSAQFSNDLNQIMIDFRLQIKSTITCSGLFDTQTLSALGTNPLCTLNDNMISVTLGQNANISTNTSLVFQEKSLYFTNCTSPITEILNLSIALPAILLKPTIIFDSNTYLTTSCDDVIINIIGYSNNGQSPLQLVKWLVTSADNITSLQPLIREWNSNLTQSSFILSQKYLSGQTNIMLSLTFKNFIDTQSTQSISINIQNQLINYLMKPMKQIPFAKFINVLLAIQVQSCQTLNQMFNVSVSIQNATAQINQTLSATAGVSYTLEFPIAQLSFNTYQLKLYDQQVEKVSLPLLVSQNFKVEIKGGDQQIGINQIMNLTGSIIDNNANTSNYQIQWLCINLLTNATCPSIISGQLLFQINTSNMSAMQSLQVTLKVNNLLEQSATIKINIINDFVNPMIITANSYSINSRVNLNDKLNLSIQSTNLVSGQLSYLKGATYQPFMQFNYSSFLVDINLLYAATQMQNVKLQLTLSPATATINLTINITPQQCQIRSTPRLNQSSFTVFGCVSNSQPLQYQFIYYNTQTDFIQDSNLGVISNGVILSDPSLESNFNTYLSGSNNSLIVALIQDSYGGQSNISTNLTGLQFINQSFYSQMLQEQNLLLNIFMILNDNYLNSYQVNQTQSGFINTTLLSGNQQNSILMTNLNLYTLIYGMQQTQLIDHMSKSKFFTQSLQEQADLLQTNENSGLSNPNFQQAMRDIQQSAYDVANFISSLYIQSNDTSEVNSLLVDTTTALTNLLTTFCSVDQGPVNITTPSFTLQAQKSSGSAANTYLETQAITNSSQIIIYTNQNFPVNPYKSQLTLNAPLIIPNLTDLAKTTVVPAQPIPFKFPLIGDISVQCASQVKGSWSLDVCKVVQTTIVQCLCETLSPLSLIEAAELIADTFAALFTSSIIGKINNFQYYKAVFTYIIGLFVLTYFFSKYYLHKIDIDSCLRVMPAPDYPACMSINELHKNKTEETIKLSSHRSKFNSMKVVGHQIIIEPTIQSGNNIDNNDECLIGQINNQSVSKIGGYFQFVKNSHPLLSLYWLYDPEEPRILRINIIFLGLFGKICIFVLFGKNLAISIVLVLSLCQTIYGITFSLILSKMIKSKSLNQFGIALAMLLTLFQIYLIIASLALYSSAYQANTAALSYLFSFGIDYFITTMIVDLLKYLLILKMFNNKTALKIFEKILPVGLQTIVFGKSLSAQATALKI